MSDFNPGVPLYFTSTGEVKEEQRVQTSLRSIFVPSSSDETKGISLPLIKDEKGETVCLNCKQKKPPQDSSQMFPDWFVSCRSCKKFIHNACIGGYNKFNGKVNIYYIYCDNCEAERRFRVHSSPNEGSNTRKGPCDYCGSSETFKNTGNFSHIIWRCCLCKREVHEGCVLYAGNFSSEDLNEDNDAYCNSCGKKSTEELIKEHQELRRKEEREHEERVRLLDSFKRETKRHKRINFLN